MKIGIEEQTKLVYETSGGRGHPLWPSPVLLQVVIMTEDAEELIPAKPEELAPNSLLFREDTYNSSSRIRRGRLYMADEMQPVTWKVHPHPVLAYETAHIMTHGSVFNKRIYSFNSIRLRNYLKNKGIERPIFLLGSERGFTIWTLVNIETSATGDELVIFRARKSIGALPNLYRSKILQLDGKQVIEFIEKLEDEIYRAGPESVVDRSREAATAILSKYLQSINKTTPGNDLGKLANKVQEEGQTVVANSARIIARLHARAKHAEQEKNTLRNITEQDAELSVQLVGTILCDIGWGEW